MNVYEILGIEKTNDFKTVKRAYVRLALQCHPDKHMGKGTFKEAQEEFKKLSNAYELVNTPEKLKKFYDDEGIQNNKTTQQRQTYSTEEFKGFPQESDALRVSTDETIDIYVPLFVSASLKDPIILFNDGKEKISFESIAEKLENKSKVDSFQVGLTYEEAIEINNQHKHRLPILIVQFEKSLNRLTDSRVSEKEMAPDVLNAKNSNYFCLLQNTGFKPEDIISYRGCSLHSYRNTLHINRLDMDVLRTLSERDSPIFNSETQALQETGEEAIKEAVDTGSSFIARITQFFRAKPSIAPSQKPNSQSLKL